jgi:hypothetical protein
MIQFLLSDELKQKTTSLQSEQLVLKKYLDCLTNFGWVVSDKESKRVLTENILTIFSQENCLHSTDVFVVVWHIKVFYNFFMRFKKIIESSVAKGIACLFRD